MKKILELLQYFPDISYQVLNDEKKANIIKRASGNTNIINQVNTLDQFFEQIKFFDEMGQKLKIFIEQNKELEITDYEFSKIQKTIGEYNSLVLTLKGFKEEIPGINEIFNSSEYINFSQNIQQYYINQNNGYRKIDLLETQIEGIINSLSIKKLDLNNNLSENPILKELKSIDIKKIKEAESIANNIVLKKEINQNQEITEHFKFFEEQASDNSAFKLAKYGNHFWNIEIISFKIIWLLLSILSGGLVIFFIYTIISEKQTLSIGDSLLRISVLTIAFYFIVYFSKQYSNHKDLYKSYIFKSVSLKVMLGLSKISSQEEKQMIYEKALDKIFSEPSINNSGKEGDIINIIKDSIPTKTVSNLKDN